MSKRNYSGHFKDDVPSSIVVFLVALPLCLGIALASGTPLFSGLIAGIVGGIVVGSLSKSQTSVSGPAAGLVVIVLNAIETLGGFNAFLTAVVLAGAIQIILGYIKAGVIGLYFPSSVIRGMLAAIGLILIIKQVPHLVGFDAEAWAVEEITLTAAGHKIDHLLGAFSHIHPGSILVGLVSVGILIIWDLPAMKRKSYHKHLPGGIVAVAAGVLLSEIFRRFVPSLEIAANHMVNIPLIRGREALETVFIFPDFKALLDPNVYVVAGTLAIVASLETLLSTEAIDRLDREKRRTPKNEELKAQGVGNMLSGLVGGLPITAVIVRSSANIAAGARTKWSAILHGILLLVAVAFLPGIISRIPLSTLAAILILVGFKLTRPALYVAQFKLGGVQFFPFIITVVAILMSDLLIGIIIGMASAAFYILKVNYKVPYHYDRSDTGSSGRHSITIKLSEHVSFLNKASLQTTLENIPDGSHVILDGSISKAIDHDALEVIQHFMETAGERDIYVEPRNIPELHEEVFAYK